MLHFQKTYMEAIKETQYYYGLKRLHHNVVSSRPEQAFIDLPGNRRATCNLLMHETQRNKSLIWDQHQKEQTGRFFANQFFRLGNPRVFMKASRSACRRIAFLRCSLVLSLIKLPSTSCFPVELDCSRVKQIGVELSEE
jgi:hypothetical protein